MIGIAHSAIAVVTATPELELSGDEAKALATASVPVLEMADFTPDPRFIAVFGLVTTSVAIYGPRAALIRIRKMEERAARAKPVFDTGVAPVSGAGPQDASFGGGPAPSGMMN